jgi:hypothetical protein
MFCFVVFLQQEKQEFHFLLRFNRHSCAWTILDWMVRTTVKETLYSSNSHRRYVQRLTLFISKCSLLISHLEKFKMFFEKFRKRIFPWKWLIRKTNGSIRNCSDLKIFPMNSHVSMFQQSWIFGQFLCPALCDRRRHQSLKSKTIITIYMTWITGKLAYW